MYRKILVPLDGSALAERVLPYARLLATCANAGLTLLRVTPEASRAAMTPRDVLHAPGDAPLHPAAHLDPVMRGGVMLSGSGPSSDTRIEHEVAEAERYLQTMEADLKKGGRAAHVMVQPGPVADTILDTARGENVDLIAMSTHGRSGIGRFLLGSVADRVTKHALAPVLLVHVSDAEKELTAPVSVQRILVPLDGSELAASVLPHVQTLAQCTGAEVVLLRVVPHAPDPAGSDVDMLMAGLSTPSKPVPTVPPVLDSDNAEQTESAHQQAIAREYLSAAADSASHWGVRVQSLMQIGHPAETIIDMARTVHADMIAMATHGRGGLRRFLTGSVADRVLQHASVPVLLVRPSQG
jgi:nucleotide-binding universal stress UspA family protein